MKFLKCVLSKLKYLYNYCFVYDSFIRCIHNPNNSMILYPTHIMYNSSLVISTRRGFPIKPNHFLYVSKSLYLLGNLEHLPLVTYINWELTTLPNMKYDSFAFYSMKVNGYMLNDSVLAILS